MIDRNKVHHRKEEGHNERASNCEREGDHTYKVSKQDRKEKVEQYSKVLLFTNVKVLFNNRAH